MPVASFTRAVTSAMFVASRAHWVAPAATIVPPSRVQISLYSSMVTSREPMASGGSGRAVAIFESKTSAPMPSVRLQVRSSRIVFGRPLSIDTTLSFAERLPRSRPQ
jgi:hypothetical protein